MPGVAADNDFLARYGKCALRGYLIHCSKRKEAEMIMKKILIFNFTCKDELPH
jgi:hypothetical protein